VIALWKKYLSKTNSTIITIDNPKAATAKAPHACEIRLQNFKYFFIIKKPLFNFHK
jgi:hypothetical protein